MILLTALTSGLVAYLGVGLVTGRLPRFTRALPKPDGLRGQQLWLVQAGLHLSPRQFWAGSAAIGVAVFAGVTLVTATPVVAVVPAVSAACLPRAYFAHERAGRMRAVQEAWPDGLRELIAGISAGMSLPQAVCALSDSGPEPLQRAFARFPLLVRLLGFGPALEVVKAELADPTSDRVLEVLLLAYERGGRIVNDVLRDLAEATTEDVKTLEEIATSALEQKINARAVFVLPWLVLLMLTAREGHFRDFYRSPGGLVVVAVAGLASLFGMWLLGRLARDPGEERVLAGGPPQPAAGKSE